jgi:hypothetical protein
MVGGTEPFEISTLAARLAEVGVAERALVQISVSWRCIILSRHGMVSLDNLRRAVGEVREKRPLARRTWPLTSRVRMT